LAIQRIAAIKAQLRRLSLKKCQAYAGQALACRTAAEVRALPLP
jgi:phosphoenolpyruvate-protein kinase (PTS system EI component)